MKALELLKDIKNNNPFVYGFSRVWVRILASNEQSRIIEAIAELEALQQRSCDGCRYGKFGVDNRGIEVECTLIWQCARGNIYADRYEPKLKEQ